MGAPVDNVHHGNRQHFGVGTTQVTEQWKTKLGGSGVCNRQRNSKNRVSAKFLFVGGTVERNHRTIDSDLIESIHAANDFGDLVFDIIDRFQYPFAEILVFLAVAQFPRFVFPGACSAWNDCPADCAASQFDVDFDCRIPSRVQDLSCSYFRNDR